MERGEARRGEAQGLDWRGGGFAGLRLGRQTDRQAGGAEERRGGDVEERLFGPSGRCSIRAGGRVCVRRARSGSQRLGYLVEKITPACLKQMVTTTRMMK